MGRRASSGKHLPRKGKWWQISFPLSPIDGTLHASSWEDGPWGAREVEIGRKSWNRSVFHCPTLVQSAHFGTRLELSTP